MALFYGQSTEIIEKQKQRKYLTYSWIYPSNSNGLKNRPKEYQDGYPTPYAAVYGLDEDSTVTLLTHKYDTDEFINVAFVMEYTMWCLHRSGKASNVLVWTTDLFTNHRVGITNIYALNHTIKFKDVVSWYKGMVGFQIEIKLISGKTYGSESVLDILVTI